MNANGGAIPFPGLRSFEDDEDHLFFGREAQSDALVERLTQSRFLAVIGSSGSGKSSLVRAGLLPNLYGGLVPGVSSAWHVAVFRPAADPLRQLALGLLGHTAYGAPVSADSSSVTRSTSAIRSRIDLEDDAGERAAMVEATLQRSSRGLVEAVRQLRGSQPHNLLVVVDQFEELFRYGGQAVQGNDRVDEAAAFVKLLLAAAEQDEIPIYVIITMRSDFLGDCARFRDLPEMLNRGQYLVPRLTRDQLRAAIEGPARVAGARVSHRLMQRLLNDVGDNPDQLPILQHALMRTWRVWMDDHADEEPLDLRHFKAIGGMESALSIHADEAYAEMEGANRQRLTQRIFQALTEQELENRAIRTPKTLEELGRIADAPEAEILSVLEVFRRPDRSFLMPPMDVDAQAHTMIDISHESLIRTWGRLGRWVREEADGAQVYRRLSDAARLHSQGEASLWRGTELDIATQWHERWRPNAAWAEQYGAGYERTMAFLAASHAAEAEESQKARLTAERQRQLRVSKLIGRTFTVLLCLAVVLTGGALLALDRLASALDRSTAISSSTEAITAGLLDLQREQDRFQLNWRRIGLELAKKDLPLANAAVTRTRAAVGELRPVLADADDTDRFLGKLSVLEERITSYEDQFAKEVDLATKRGFKRGGAVGAFRDAAQGMEDELESDLRLHRDVLQLRRSEKDFLLRHEVRDRDDVYRRLGDLREAAKAFPGFARLADDYSSSFDALVELEDQLIESETALDGSIRELGAVSDNISALAREHSEAASADANTVSLVVVIAGIVILLFGAVLGWVVLHDLPTSLREAGEPPVGDPHET